MIFRRKKFKCFLQVFIFIYHNANFSKSLLEFEKPAVARMQLFKDFLYTKCSRKKKLLNLAVVRGVFEIHS